MANRFKDKTMRAEYDAIMFAYDTKHRNLFYENGDRCRGNGMADMFWRGFDGTMLGGIWDAASKNTLMYAYWRAGQDAKKKSLEK